MNDKYLGSTLYTYTSGLWGVPTTYIERLVNCDTSPVMLANNNPRRMLLLVVNNASNPTTVAFTPAVAVGSGIVITSGGASITFTAFEDGELTGAALYGISPVASGTWYVLEVIAV